jgi:S1-C subfamily serine protease
MSGLVRDSTELQTQAPILPAPVLRESPIYVAGLDRGDKITEFEGKSLKTEREFARWVDSHKPRVTKRS